MLGFGAIGEFAIGEIPTDHLAINSNLPGLLLQTLILPGERTNDGRIIEAVAVPWLDIVAMLAKDPSAAFQISPEKWEEILPPLTRKLDLMR